MLHNPLITKLKAYEELLDQAKKENWAIGSYKSFARLLDKPEIKALLLRATSGDRGVRNSIAPFIKRDLNCYESLEMICGDQIVFDFNSISPTGEIANPNAFVWVDMGSGAIIGVDLVFGRYNRLGVGRALKMALGFGMPDAIYTDNGKPELSRYIQDVRSQLSGIKFKDFDDLNPTLLHKKAKPANSRAKPIENIFNHLQRWMKEDILIKCGGASYHKDMRKNAELLKTYMKTKPLNYKDFIYFFERAVRKWNEHYNQSRKIYPMQTFLEKLEKRGAVKFDEVTLDFIFSERKKIKVRNSSVSITINGVRYYYINPLLSKYTNKQVEVRIDDKDINYVNIVDIDTNKFLCRAILDRALDPRDAKLVKDTIDRNETIVKSVKDAFNYYKDLYKKPNYISSYAGVAHSAKVKSEKKQRKNEKMNMSNEELIKALKAM